MPSSKANGKERIKEFIDSKDIKTILDIGCGSGTYPKLLGDKYSYTGVEIFHPYIKMFNLNDYYEDIVVADASEAALPVKDCIILGDVVEHMKKNKALPFLKRVLEDFKHVVLSIPVNEDGSIVFARIHHANVYEAHVSGWTLEEIKKLAKWELIFESGGIGVFLK